MIDETGKYRILGECLLIARVPDKTLRTLVESRDLLSGLTCILEAKPGTRRESGILLIMFTYWFTLQTNDHGVIKEFCVDSASLPTSFKKCNLIMT